MKILEIDSERRRLSLSAKRVEDQILPVSRPGEPEGEADADAQGATETGEPTSEAAVAQDGDAPQETSGSAATEAIAEQPAAEEGRGDAVSESPEPAGEAQEAVEEAQGGEEPEAAQADETAQSEEAAAPEGEADGSAAAPQSSQQG